MRLLPLLALSLGIGGMFAGCSKNGDTSLESVEGEPTPLFQAKKGIWLPEEMKTAFGVEVTEVAEQPMQREVRKLARVYREAQDGAEAGASVMLAPAETKDLKPGHLVRLQGPGFEKEFFGKLTQIDEHTQSALGQAEALIDISAAPERLAAGTFLTATFLLGEPKPVLVVPRTALLSAADGTFVYALNGAHFTRIKISTGAARDGIIEVEEGLYAGDVVVMKGVESLWLIELSALKGGKPCCAVPRKETASAR